MVFFNFQNKAEKVKICVIIKETDKKKFQKILIPNQVSQIGTTILKKIDKMDLACQELKMYARKTKKKIQVTFAELRAELDRQEIKLMRETETTLLKKEKKLKIQINNLQVQHRQIQTAILFY